MEYLGINRELGAIYEGNPRNGYRVLPPPSLTPIRFFSGGTIEALAPWLDDGLAQVVFREDDFDPVTKVRRGRVFKLSLTRARCDWFVVDPYRTDLKTNPISGSFVQQALLTTYERDTLDDLRKAGAGKQPSVILGWEPHVTFWKIVSIECNLVGTPVLSLRARHSLGDTPEIIEKEVPEPLLKPLVEAVEKVEASVNRLSAVDVIDRCRSALSIVFGYKAGDMSKDLGKAIEAYVQKEPAGKENLCASCGRIVARLHSRGKPNEQVGKGLRPPTDSDADLALHCLKTVLIEFGWAR